MFGPCTKVEGPVRAARPPSARASTQTRQRQPGRGIVAAPPEPRISTLTRSRLPIPRPGLQRAENGRQPATTSLATSPAWCGSAAAARPWAVAAAAAAVTGSSPLARNAATTPVSTSPVPAVASDGGPASQTTGPPVGRLHDRAGALQQHDRAVPLGAQPGRLEPVGVDPRRVAVEQARELARVGGEHRRVGATPSARGRRARRRRRRREARGARAAVPRARAPRGCGRGPAPARRHPPAPPRP